MIEMESRMVLARAAGTGSEDLGFNVDRVSVFQDVKTSEDWIYSSKIPSCTLKNEQDGKF